MWHALLSHAVKMGTLEQSEQDTIAEKEEICTDGEVFDPQGKQFRPNHSTTGFGFGTFPSWISLRMDKEASLKLLFEEFLTGAEGIPAKIFFGLERYITTRGLLERQPHIRTDRLKGGNKVDMAALSHIRPTSKDGTMMRL